MDGYRNDPEWQAARDVFTSDHPGNGTAASDLVACLAAARRMYEIELRYERATSAVTAAT